MKCKIILRTIKFIIFMTFYLYIAFLTAKIDDAPFKYMIAFLAGYVWCIISDKFDDFIQA